MPPELKVLCARLLVRSYDGAFIASGMVSDLTDLGCSNPVLITGDDGAGRLPYGFVCTSSFGPICVIRGTILPKGNPLAEWIDNLKAVLEYFPYLPGIKWHEGFGTIYKTLQVQGLALHDYLNRVSAGVDLTITGHSLGAALATYAAILSRADTVCLFASPKAGDSDLQAAFNARVAVGVSLANPNDAVPQLPITVDFPFKIEDFQQACPLTLLPASRVSPPIAADWYSSHQIENYLALVAA